MMQRIWRPLIVIIAGMLLFVGCGGKSGKSTTAPSTLAVKAGINDPNDKSIAVLAFLPAAVNVNVGEKVEWTVAGPEPHTISLAGAGKAIPNPGSPQAIAFQSPKPATGGYDGTNAVSSGLGPTGPQPLVFDLSFSKVGTYQYFCAIHAQMRGTVNVVSDRSKAESQATVTGRGDREQAGHIAEGESTKQEFLKKQVKKTKASDGTTTWTILTGTSTAHTDVLAFQPAGLQIKPGDKVEFLNESAAPHTGTFALGVQVPQNPEADKVVKPSAKSPITLGSSGYFNSGWLPPNVPPGGAPPESARSFTFTVPKAGTYNFICVLHIPSGMGGSIKVT